MIGLQAINFDGLGEEIVHIPLDREKKQGESGTPHGGIGDTHNRLENGIRTTLELLDVPRCPPPFVLVRWTSNSNVKTLTG